MSTSDFIEILSADIANGIEKKLLEKLVPLIEQRIYSNVFNTEEARKYLKVSVRTLRRMVSANEVPHFWQRGQIFFRQSDLDSYIDDKVSKRRTSG